MGCAIKERLGGFAGLDGAAGEVVEVDLQIGEAGFRVELLSVCGVVGVEVMLTLPCVGNAVVVAVRCGFCFERRGKSADLGFVGDEMAAGAEGEEIVDQAGVYGVAAEGVTGLACDFVDNFFGRVDVDGNVGVGEGLRDKVCVRVLEVLRGYGAAVELAVAVEIDEVALLIGVIGFGELSDEGVGGVGAFDEVVADEVGVVVCGGVAADVAVDAPVVDDVVDVLDMAFAFGVSALVVNPEIVAEGEEVAFAETAEALGNDAFADDGVLDGGVVVSVGLDVVQRPHSMER